MSEKIEDEKSKAVEAQAETVEVKELSEDELLSSFMETDIEELHNDGVDDSYVGDENIYAPSIEDEKAVNREYKSFIRFMKNPRKNPTNKLKHIVSKFVVFLPNPTNPDSRIMVDDISTHNRNNIITNAFFFCRGSKSLALQKLAKTAFSRKSYNWTLVKVEKDNQHPEHDGKIKVFRFASQVDEILKKALENDPENEIHAKLYSDPVKGYKFVLNINEKEVDSKDGDGKMTMVNYTESRFVDQPSALSFEGIDEKWFESKEGQISMFKHILAETPVLENYEAKIWDEETENLVIEAVKTAIDDPQIFDKIYFKTYNKSYFGEQGKVTKAPLIGENEEVDEFKEKTETVAETKKVETPKTSVEDSAVEKIDDVDLDD